MFLEVLLKKDFVIAYGVFDHRSAIPNDINYMSSAVSGFLNEKHSAFIHKVVSEKHEYERIYMLLDKYYYQQYCDEYRNTETTK